jgi:ABC-type dipeptide/oligopeptide/nickel transport systems, permease components
VNQLNYIVRRILQIIPVLLVVSVLIFLMLRLIPGDPARLMLGDKAKEAAVVALREKLGLNRPLPEQYFLFMKRLLVGDLGTSLTYQRPVAELLAARLPITISLTLASTFLSLLFSFPLGYFAAKHKDKAGDQVVRASALVAIAMPSFWVALLLMIVFCVKLHWLPVGGWGSNFLERARSLILPAFTQSLMTTALLMRNIRNSVVDISVMDYVDFARSKGITDRAVRDRHIFRNALISTVTLLAMRMAYMLGGSVIIETVFSLPGLGKLMVDSIFGRDYTVVQSLVFLFALMVLVINLITDVIYSLLDPRVSF